VLITLLVTGYATEPPRLAEAAAGWSRAISFERIYLFKALEPELEAYEIYLSLASVNDRRGRIGCQTGTISRRERNLLATDEPSVDAIGMV